MAIPDTQPVEAPALTAIHYYPIKSCRGIAAVEGTVTRRGLAGDRRMMVVEPDGTFLTQRQHPRMALIEPELEGDHLLLRAPGMEPLRVELRAGDEPRRVSVWSDHCTAWDQGPEAAEWLSTYLRRPCGLVRQRDDEPRLVDPSYAVDDTDEVSFADGYPLLLTAEESLSDLNARIGGEPLPMDRFRPSLTVAGAEAYAEDGWRRIRIGSVEFAVVKPCARCVVTTIDQRTAKKGREPLKMLATYRVGSSGGVIFGQNLIPTTEGRVRVGDRVEVLRVREG